LGNVASMYHAKKNSDVVYLYGRDAANALPSSRKFQFESPACDAGSDVRLLLHAGDSEPGIEGGVISRYWLRTQGGWGGGEQLEFAHK